MTIELEGIYPATPVVFTDYTCRDVDYEATRAHYRFLLDHGVNGLCVGGHAGETECLTMEERLCLIDVAREDAAGSVPVIGGVIADSTWAAIEQVQAQKSRGADAVLICPPNILGWDADNADEMLVAHCQAIDREGGLPFLVYGGPGDRSCCRQLPATLTKVALACANLVAWKIAVRGVSRGENSFTDCVAALTKSEQITGRRVAALIAGDADLLGVLEAGGQGNVNACESIRVEDNTALYAAFRKGDLDTARAIQARVAPIPKVIYGMGIGRSFTFFHYRFKIATWMLGRIHNPIMRLPQVPPPADEIAVIFDALVAAGKKPVHSAEDFAALGLAQAAE